MTTPPRQPADALDPELAQWQQAFDAIIHPGLTKVLDTLIEMESRLAPAVAYLDSLDANDTEQAARGIAVAGFALDYADQHLDHFGLWDGPPAPKPPSFSHAKTALNNVLTFVRGWIVFYRQELAAQHDNDEDEGTDAATVAATTSEPGQGSKSPTQEKPTADEGTFEAVWKGTQCFLGNTMEFKVFAHLCRRPGFYFTVKNLLDDVWGDDRVVSDGTVQKTISNLRKKLKAAGMDGLEIDGSQQGTYALKIR